MTYWLLNLVFLGIVLLVAASAILLKRSPRWGAVGITAIVLLVMTAIFDNVMIGVGLVAYEPEHLSGIFVGIAPLEDFSYAIAAVVLLPSLWTLLGPSDRWRGGDRVPRGSDPSGIL